MLSAISGLMVLSSTALAAPPMPAGNEKCFGVAKAGDNNCASANGSHACAGMATKDHDPNEWIYTPTGTCTKMGGKLKAG